MKSSRAESITNWPNDRSTALGGPAGADVVNQIRPAELFPPAIMTDARGLARASAASLAMRSNESGEPTRAEPASRQGTACSAVGRSSGAVPADSRTSGSTVGGAVRATRSIPLCSAYIAQYDIRTGVQAPAIVGTQLHAGPASSARADRAD